MEQYLFRYQIFRYIPDIRRMEPENFGIIVQNSDGVSCRFHTHMGGRKDFDFDNYRHWREFFEAEISGPAVQIFQPKRNSLEFLEYMQERCTGNYSLTRPLDIALSTNNLKQAEEYLFHTLVLRPEHRESPEQKQVQRFKYELKTRGFDKHPAFKHNALFKTNGLTELVEYYYRRNHGADLPVIIQPVQILLNNSMSPTINAMERAETLIATIHEAKVNADISVVVDKMQEPKADDSDAVKWVFERIQKGKINLAKHDAKVVDSTSETIQLAESIQKDLEDIETPKSQTEMSL